MDNANLIYLIPRLLKRLRQEQNLSQEDLAALSELDRTYISGVERGGRNITIKSLSKILCALGIDIEKFIIELKNELLLIKDN